MPAGASPSSATCGRVGGVRPCVRGFQTGRSARDRHREMTRAGSASLQDVRDLALAIQDVDGHEDHAELHAGEIEVDHLDAVGEIDAQAVARRRSPRCEQQVRQPIAARVDLAERVMWRLRIRAPTVSRRPIRERSKRCSEVHAGSSLPRVSSPSGSSASPTQEGDGGERHRACRWCACARRPRPPGT